MLNMGVEPFLVASAVMAVIAQRLVRRLCTECRAECRRDDKAESLPAPLDGIERWWQPAGCAACEGIGYRGRTGLFELLEVDEGQRALVMDRAPESRLQESICGKECSDLSEDLKEKVAAGRTSPEEGLSSLI